jgi:uncharacterized protein (TIGR03437 family)
MRLWVATFWVVVLAATVAWAAPEIQNLELVGQLALGPGFNAGVWVHKNAAYVGTWGTATNCPATGVKIVDLTNPATPRLANRVAYYPNTSAESIVVRHIETNSFRGDLLAVGLQSCRNGQAARRGVELYDVTDPRNPRLLQFVPTGTESAGVHELDLVQRASDGRVLLLLATIARLRVIDATDPARARQVSDWSLAERTNEAASSSKFAHSVEASADGQMAFLSYWAAGVILLDLSDPTNPRVAGRTKSTSAEETSAHSVAVSRNRQLMLSANENLDPGSASSGYTDWGYLRVYDVANPSAPRQIGAYLTPNAHTDRESGPRDDGFYSIRNAQLAGNYGYLSWYSDGVRVVDLANPRSPVEVGSYVPPDTPDPYGVWANKAQVWGVVTQPERNLVVASDINFGLYVLRPLEPKPVNGVVNAASFAERSPVAPGAIVAVRGLQLAASAMSAEFSSASTSLAGAVVKVNGELAQLLFASPEQINFVMPADTPLGTAEITVENLGRASTVISTEVVDAAPGLFTQSHDGRGTVAAQGAADNSEITAEHAAHAGDMIWLKVSGLGESNPEISVLIGDTAVTPQSSINQDGVSRLLVRVPDGASGQARVIVTANGRASNSASLPVE